MLEEDTKRNAKPSNARCLTRLCITISKKTVTQKDYLDLTPYLNEFFSHFANRAACYSKDLPVFVHFPDEDEPAEIAVDFPEMIGLPSHLALISSIQHWKMSVINTRVFMFRKSWTQHSNVILIHPRSQTIEHFEPYGAASFSTVLAPPLETWFRNIAFPDK